MAILLPSDVAYAHYVGERGEKFEYPQHVQHFERASLNLLYGNVNRQMISCPVRHGKSSWHTVIMPAYYLITHPDQGVLITCASQDLVERFVPQICDLVERFGTANPQYGIKINPRNRSRKQFSLDGRRGEVYGASAGSQVNGMGFGLIVGDDLVKDEAAARSPTERNNLRNWWHGDCERRLNPGGKISLIMSRKHPKDLLGELWASNDDMPVSLRYHRIVFKAIQDDGTSLWPSKFPIKDLYDIRDGLIAARRSLYWASMYQQDPRSDPEACYFPDDYFVDIFGNRPANVTPMLKIVSIDPSLSGKGDYCAILACTYGTDKITYVEDAVVERITATSVIDEAVTVILRFKPQHVVCDASVGQIPIINEIKRRLDVSGYRCRCHPYIRPPQQKKEGDIRMMLDPGLRNHMIKVVDNRGGRLLVSQAAEFPSGENDDAIDSLAMAEDLADKIISRR